MTHPFRNHGIAVISTLLIALVVIGVGIGAITLNRSNLRVASNVETGAIARLSADSGIEAVVASLTDFHGRYLTLPNDVANVVVPTMTVDGTAVSYTLETGGYLPDPLVGGRVKRASVSLVGTGPNAARFVTEAVVAINVVAGEGTQAHGLLTNGLTGRGVVSLSGGGEFVDAGIHGGRGYDIDGSGSGSFGFDTCEETGRQFDGSCGTDDDDRTTIVITADVPVTADSDTADDAFVCSVSGQVHDGICTSTTEDEGGDSPRNNNGKNNGNDGDGGGGGSTSSKPTNLTPDPIAAAGDGFTSDYGVTRDRVLCTVLGSCEEDVTFDDLILDGYCELLSGPLLLQEADAGDTLCIEGGVSIPAGFDLSNTTLIVEGDVTMPSGSATLDGTVIVTFDGGSIELSTNTVQDSRLLAEGTLCINDLDKCPTTSNGNSSNYDIDDVDVRGISTLATGGSLPFGPQASLGGDLPYTSVAIIAQQDVTIRGDHTSWAVFLVGCNFGSANGSQEIFGGIVAVDESDGSDGQDCGNVSFNGAVDIDSGVRVGNPDLPQESTDGIEVVSIVRRR